MGNSRKKALLFLLTIVLVAVSCFMLVACGDVDSSDTPKDISYTISFDTQGGSEIAPITIKPGETVTMPEKPTKDGYVFDGWYLSAEFINRFNETQVITSDITLYARWKSEQAEPPVTTYKITFIVDGVEYDALTIENGATITFPDNPTKTCYVFEGWYLDEEFVNQFDSTKGISQNVTLYAKWRENHTPVVDVAVNATCTATGLTEGSHCSVCDKVLVAQQSVPMLDHDLVHHGAKAPTCIDVGWEAYDTCSRCDYTTYSEISINTNNHTFDDGVCTSCGYIEYGSEGLEYALNNDGESYYVKGIGAFEGSNLKIPSVYNEKPVTMIGDKAFKYCTGLKRVSIPDSVTSINYYAFQNCKGLTSITIPDRVTSIADYAFYKCTSLVSVTIPDSVTSIGERAFSGCEGLTSVTIGSGVTSIGYMSFGNCPNLESIYYTGDVASWCGISNLGRIMSSSRTLYIGGDKVEGDLVIPYGVTTIVDYAFSYCTNLTSITIPDNVTSIGYMSFGNCSNLKSIYYTGDVAGWCGISGLDRIMSRSITLYIGGNKVEGDLVIPNGVTSIGVEAFYGCKGLTSITIPDSVTSIGDYAFRGCTGLTSIIVSEGNTVYHSKNNCLIKTESKTLILGCKSSVIPNGDSVTTIADFAFEDCTGLTSITIGNGVTSIGQYAFYNCSNLENIYYTGDVAGWCGISGLINIMSDSITLYIGGNKVEGDLVIPNGLTSIGGYAFYNCNGLTSVTIPDSVTSIGYSAFRGCSGLTSITIPFVGTSKTASNGYDQVFGYVFGYTTESNVSGVTYQYYDDYNRYQYYIPSSLKTVVIGDGATTIPSDAFWNCRGLTSITIPDSVTSMGDYVFRGCTGLTRIDYNGTIEQWNAIDKGYWWNDNTGDYTVYCTDGSIAKDGTVTYNN